MTTAGRPSRALGPPSLLGLAALVVPALAIPVVVWAAALSPGDLSDLKRAYAASALSSSEAPAVRAERALREPSAGFMLGAALGAWTAAREQLDFDLKNPAAAGAPHASQGPANLDALDQDCREENTAFERLESRVSGLGLDAKTVLQLAAVTGADAVLDRWLARRTGSDRACR